MTLANADFGKKHNLAAANRQHWEKLSSSLEVQFTLFALLHLACLSLLKIFLQASAEGKSLVVDLSSMIRIRKHPRDSYTADTRDRDERFSRSPSPSYPLSLAIFSSF